jgi:hypothetical protein
MPFLGKTPTKLLDANVNIDGGNIDGTTIGAASAASATVTTFTSTGIDDNATSTAITIDASENVGIGTASPSSKISLVSSGVNGLHLGQQSDNTSNSSRLFFDNSTNIWTAYSTVGNFKIASGATIGTSSGTDRLVIDSSGNVGIGTASPSSTLHLYGSGTPIRLNIEATTGRVESRLDNTSGAFIFGIDDSSGSGFGSAYSRNIYSNGAYPMLFWTNNAERMRIDSSGNILFKNINDISDRGSGTGTLRMFHENNISYIISQGTDASNKGQISFRTSDGGTANERMRIDSSGRLGIGTSSPSDKLDVKASGDDERLVRISHPSSPTLAAGYFGFTDTGSGANTGVTLGVQYAGDYYNAITIDRETQNVGIGTTSPAALLDVADGNIRLTNTSGSGSYHDFAYGGTNGENFFINADRGSTGSGNMIFRVGGASEKMRIDSSGTVMIGKSSTSIDPEGLLLYGNGEIYSTIASGDSYVLYDTTNNAYRFRVSSAGQISATSTSITAISDASLKENVRDLDKGLDTINALQPRRFDWKNGDGNDIMGFIAQEVEDVLPELVHEYKYTDEENKKGLKMGDMVPSMVKAIQELSAQVTQLKAEVAALKGE